MLHEIQARLKAPKNQRNKFGDYNYRSCEDILEALKPVLKDHNCSITISDKMVEVGGRIYVEATATIRDNEMKPIICNTAYAREEENKKGMDSAQITGAASSYARKYALNGLFAIDDTKDPDATNKHGKGKPAEVTPQPKHLNNLMEKIDNCSTLAELETFLAKALPYAKGVMTKQEYAEAERYIKQMKDILKTPTAGDV